MAFVDPTLLLLFGGTALFLVVVVLWFLWKPLLVVVPAPLAAVRRDLAYRLRATGLTVDTATDVLRVKIDSLSALKLHVRSGSRGTEVRYEVDATSLGWALVLIFAIVGYLGVIAVVLALVIHATSSRFARTRVVALLTHPPLGTLPTPDVRSLLLEGLSEAQRLASEALEYEREARQNAIGLILVGAVALWALVFLVVGSYVPLPNAPLSAAILAFAVSAATGSLGSSLVYSRTSARVKELEQDASFYRVAWTDEVVGIPTTERARGGLELLLRAAERSSYWREVRRRRRLWHDPVAGFTLFVLAYGAIFLPILAILAGMLPVEWRIFLFGLGAFLAAGMVWFVRSWTREVRGQDERDRLDWEMRRRAIESELWRLLSG